MYRTHTCGQLRLSDAGNGATLCGWVQRVRNLGGVTFVDLRDRYGITQAVVDNDSPEAARQAAAGLGREFVVQIRGLVAERSAKNAKIATGEIELRCQEIVVLNAAETPPFTIEDESDGGDELRMRYRYLDLRRGPLQRNLALRHRMAQIIRNYLSDNEFLEIETPMLIKSTPEGARDFVVPSRMNPNEFYALPQSPQQLKQLLMVAGYDRYFQIVKCFRDEDLRADRQPEFTQVDCEMSFVEQDDVLSLFEGLARKLFAEVRGADPGPFPRLTWREAMESYGSDKPDLRFGMPLVDITELTRGRGFGVFDQAEYVTAICAKGCASFTRKKLDELTDYVKRQQIGAKGLVYVRWTAEGMKSSVDKFYAADDLARWFERCGGAEGDLLLVLCGARATTQVQAGALRLELGRQLGLMDKDSFAPLWVVDFPLLEWDDEAGRYHAMHHPFTAPKDEDVPLLESDPGQARANAYDMVINGVEVGGGSLRIHDSQVQARMFGLLGFTPEQARAQFGFLIDAFRYGAPPHAGIALGFDRLVSLFAGLDSIRDVMAFPKNNTGRDTMMDAPSAISQAQLDELLLDLRPAAK